VAGGWWLFAFTRPPLLGCFPLPNGEGYDLDDAFGITENVVVPEPDDVKALGFQKSRSPCVIVLRHPMLTAIDFDDQLHGEAEKIGEKGTNGYLSPEFCTREIFPKHPPHPLFSFGGVLA